MFELIEKVCLQYIVCPPESADKLIFQLLNVQLISCKGSLFKQNVSLCFKNIHHLIFCKWIYFNSQISGNPLRCIQKTAASLIQFQLKTCGSYICQLFNKCNIIYISIGRKSPESHFYLSKDAFYHIFIMVFKGLKKIHMGEDTK